MTVYTGESLINETIARGQLVSASARLPETSLLAVLGRYAAEPRLYWRFGAASPAYAGVGIAAALTAVGRGRFEQIREQLNGLFDGAALPANIPAVAHPRVFGGFSYDSDFDSQGIWSTFPPALFVLPRYQITRFEGQTWLTANTLIEQGDAAHAEDLLRASIDRFAGEALPANGGNGAAQPGLEVNYLVEQDIWTAMVGEAVTRIRRGELEKVVLARAAEVHSTQAIDPVRALSALDERYPDCYRFLIEPQPGHAFFGATPELLANIDGQQVTTGALAGSIRRGATPEEDAALGERLISNSKERHEHALVVHDIEQRLAPLTTTLEVAEQPSLRRLRNIQHLDTGIAGRLAAGVDALHVVDALHPTPALGGTPRDEARRLIANLEPHPRGWYGAPVGWLDGDGNGQFAVAIRSAVSAGNDARLYAGAGIVANSIPESEWQETALKFRPLLDAITSQPVTQEMRA